MKLEQLHYLCEAIRHRSMSIAAEENHLSQPSFSTAINGLEKELGAVLLKRTNKGVSPTEAGIFVQKKAEIIFSAIDDIKNNLSTTTEQGTIRFSCIAMFYSHLLFRLLGTLKEGGYTFKLNPTTIETAQIIQNVVEKVDDFGIIISAHDLLPKSLSYKPLFLDRYRLHVGTNSPLYHRDSVTLAEALHAPYIAYRHEFLNQGAVWTRVLGDLKPNIAFRTDDISLIHQLIAADNYVAFFPEYMTAKSPLMENGSIRSIPVSDASLEVEIGYIYNHKYALRRIDKQFIQVLDTMSLL